MYYFTRILHKFALLGGGLYVAYLLKKTITTLYCRHQYTICREKKIKQLADGKRKFAEYLAQRPMSQEDIDRITQIPFVELTELLRHEDLSQAYVLLAYQHKAFQVDQKLNCVVEFIYPDLNEVNMKGPLAGAPVSVKESIKMKNIDHLYGCVYNLNEPQNVDSLATKMILDLGGVPFVTTNVPQTMMSVLCSNPIVGCTKNPLRIDRSPGGSSGGEAALISAGGCQLGFGTDLGGSIRIPAAMCGIIGFKPTSGRLSLKDLSMATKLILPSWGPICRDMGTLSLITRHLFKSDLQKIEDPTIPPLPYIEIPSNRVLRVGYFVDMGIFAPVPAVRRALLHVKEKLIAQGHTVIEWKPPIDGQESMELFLTSVFADGGALLRKILNYDIVDPILKGTYSLFTMSKFQKLWYRLLAYSFDDRESTVIFNAANGLGNVSKAEEHLKRVNEFKKKFLCSWVESELDVVLSPVVGFAAALPLVPKGLFTGMLSFANLSNLIGLPSGTLPSGVIVEPEDILILKEAIHEKDIVHGRDINETSFYKNYGKRSLSHYSQFSLQEGTEGLPVNVQISALPWKDELCMYAMQEAERAVKSKLS